MSRATRWTMIFVSSGKKLSSSAVCGEQPTTKTVASVAATTRTFFIAREANTRV